MIRRRFVFPKGLGGESITISELSVSDRMDISKFYKSDGDATAWIMEQIKRSIVELNDKPVNKLSIEFEVWWNNLDAKKRTLLTQAYTQFSDVSSKDLDNVLKTETKLVQNGKEVYEYTISGHKVLFLNMSVERLVSIAKESKDNVFAMSLLATISAIEMVDGKPIQNCREYFESLSSKDQMLYTQVYQHISSPSDDETTSFFGSMKETSGNSSATSAATANKV